MAALVVGMLAGCETEASRVEYNLTQEEDNFNIVRHMWLPYEVETID